MLECINLNKSYIKDNLILNNINIKFPDVGFIFIYGESGCGKTTLINILENIDKDYQGIVKLNDINIKNIKTYSKDIFIIFQEKNFISNLSVKESIYLILKSKNKLNKINELYDDAKKEFNENILNNKINQLSGGEKQRLILLIAFKCNNKILFCDEITGSVDEENEIKILSKLKDYSKNNLIISISHNIELYKKFADSTYFLFKGNLNQII